MTRRPGPSRRGRCSPRASSPCPPAAPSTSTSTPRQRRPLRRRRPEPAGPPPLARAALAAAVARPRPLSPAFVAPARRPRALPALTGAALALLVVAAWPARAPGARRDVAAPPATSRQEPRQRVAAEMLETELAEIMAAATAGDAPRDGSPRALPRETRAPPPPPQDGPL